MHTVAVRADGQTKYVTIFFQRADDLKRSYQALSEVRFLGKVLPEQVANVVGAGKADTLAWSIWDLRVFGGADTMSESFAIALSFIDSYLGDGGASWARKTLDVVRQASDVAMRWRGCQWKSRQYGRAWWFFF